MKIKLYEVIEYSTYCDYDFAKKQPIERIVRIVRSGRESPYGRRLLWRSRREYLFSDVMFLRSYVDVANVLDKELDDRVQSILRKANENTI